jgi:hypothetical protein
MRASSIARSSARPRTICGMSGRRVPYQPASGEPTAPLTSVAPCPNWSCRRPDCTRPSWTAARSGVPVSTKTASASGGRRPGLAPWIRCLGARPDSAHPPGRDAVPAGTAQLASVDRRERPGARRDHPAAPVQRRDRAHRLRGTSVSAPTRAGQLGSARDARGGPRRPEVGPRTHSLPCRQHRLSSNHRTQRRCARRCPRHRARSRAALLGPPGPVTGRAICTMSGHAMPY